MAQTVQLKRSALSGKVPGTGSLNLGELALNTYDGKIFFRRSGSTDTVQEVITTNVLNTGSVTLTETLTAGSIVGSISASNGVVSGSSQVIGILSSLNSYTSSINIWSSSLATTGSNQFKSDQNITGSLRATLTGSFGSLNVNDTLNINHGIATISGSLGITSDLTVLGQVNARQFNISVISSSVLFESGSSKFGNSSDDTHQFTGSVSITGSFLLNGSPVGGTTSGSFTGSFTGDGSGLRGVISDDIPRDGYDYNSNITGSGSISDFNVNSDKYQIDFAQSQSTAVGTPVGFKGFLSNVSGSTQVLPTLNSIDFVVGNNVVASIGASGIIATVTAGTVSGSSQVVGILGSLNTYTSSQDTKNTSIATYTSSLETKNSTLATYTSSLETKNSTLATYTASVSSQLSNLNTATSSYETNGRGIVSGSSQITFSGISSLPTLVSGSSQITYTSISSIPSGIVSGSSQITPLLPTGTISGSSQITYTSISSIPSGIVSGSSQITPLLPTGVVSGSSQITYTSISSIPSGIVSGSSQITPLLPTGVVSGSSQITYTSVSSIPGGIVSGSSQITPLLPTGVVSGSSQITYTSVSSIPGGIVSGSSQVLGGTGIVSGSSQVTPLLPTGVISGSSQLSGTTITNLTITNLTTVNETASVIFSSGSNRFGDFGDDTHSFTGSVQISGSITTIGSSTATSFNGSINATNGVVSGSSQITYANIASIPGGIVSGSSQVVSILSSLNTYTGSNDTLNSLQTTRIDQLAAGTASVNSFTASNGNTSLNSYTASNDTTNTAQNTRLTTIESVTGSYETKGRSIVSGSSQIDVMSTTNIARLATTGSNTFTGNQTITGTINTISIPNDLFAFQFLLMGG